MGRWDPSLDRGICSLREGKFAAVLQLTGRPGAPFAIHISANVPPEEINQRLTLTRCMEFWTWHPACRGVWRDDDDDGAQGGAKTKARGGGLWGREREIFRKRINPFSEQARGSILLGA
jgi:hypothetical protein